MLNPSQISDMKHKEPDSFNLWRTVVDAVNTGFLLLGIDCKPASHVAVDDAIPAPRPPASITVSVVSSVVFVQLGAAPGATESVFYFVQKGTTPKFEQVETYALGHSRQLAIPQDTGTTYWRAYSKYQMSQRSAFIVYATSSSSGGGSGVETSGAVGGLSPLEILAQ